jgi:hypothetical protein
MFAALVQYKAEHGHCDLRRKSCGNPKLANWVNTMRQDHKRGKLSRERIQRLEEIGFHWIPRPPPAWDNKYAALAEYQREHGHCCVSTVDPGYRSLANWVHKQRKLRRDGRLNVEQIWRLDALGFKWEGSQADRAKLLARN